MAEGNTSALHVEIVYAGSENAMIVPLLVEQGTTMRKAIQLSAIMDYYPEIDLAINKIGVFSKLRDIDSPLEQGDRVEIYRPLLADPKEMRRRRAAIQIDGGN